VAAGAAVETRSDQAAAFAKAHAELLSDESIQFDLTPLNREPPGWLRSLIDFIGDNMPLFRIFFWVAVAILAGVLLYNLAKALDLLPQRRSDEGGEDALPTLRPEEKQARALLAEADSLAEVGRFDEAAHLLLFRSIEEIDKRRPRFVRVSLTSRDIAGSDAVPDAPRSAFALIVDHVERSLFGGRSLHADDWRECRAAYERFAFKAAWQ
jgi:hypothetical protein